MARYQTKPTKQEPLAFFNRRVPVEVREGDDGQLLVERSDAPGYWRAYDRAIFDRLFELVPEQQ